jgi:hypothetical protein
VVGTVAAGALLAVGATGAAGAVAPTGAAPRASAWGPVVDLAASPGISRPDVVVGPRGATTVVWRTQNGIVAVTRSPGGAWGAPHRLGNGTSPAAAVDGRGGVTVIWVRHQPDMGPQVMTAHRRPGAAWSRARALSKAVPSNGSSFPGAFRPRLAVGHDGASVATWMWGADDSGGSRVQVRYRPAGGLWRPPVVLSPVEARTPECAVGADGRAVVVYTVNARVLAVRRTASGWSPRERIGSHAQPPLVAMDDRGRATAVWSAYDVDDAAFRPQAATAAPGRSWRPPVTLDPGVSTSSQPVVGITPTGRTTVAWTRDTGQVLTAAHVPGRPWSGPRVVADRGAQVVGVPPFLGLAVGRSGAAVLTWTRGPSGAQRVESTYHPPGQGWQGTSVLSPADVDAAAAEAYVGPGAQAVTAWRGVDDAGSEHLQLRFLGD